MTFDQQLERAFDTISGVIRAEVSRQVHAVSDELAAARAAAAARESESMIARLADGIRTIGGARSLSEILDTLVTCAGLDASRAGVLLVRGDRFHGWRFIGFGASFDHADAIEIGRTDAGVIARAADTGTVKTGGRDGATPKFAELPVGRSCAAFPLMIGGQTVAVLYADAGGPANDERNHEPNVERNLEPNLEPGTLNLEPLEVLTRFAARSLEALTATKAARMLVRV